MRVLKKFALIVFAACVGIVSWPPVTAHAMPGGILWEAVYSSRPGFDSDHANGLAIDRQGNLLITGYVTGRDGNNDYLTVKYGPYGTTEWIKTYDNSWYDVGKAVAADNTGNVIVAGASNNLENPRDTYSSSYYTDYRVVKYDPSGAVLFEMTASGNHKNNEPAAVAVDEEGGIYVTGYAKNAPDTFEQYYTVKFDPAGELLWERAEESEAEGYATGIKLDTDGTVLVTGYVKDLTNNNYNIRTLRYSPDGREVLMDLVYDRLFEDEKAWGVTTDKEGNVIVVGESSENGGVTLVLKYSPEKELLWASRYTRSEYKNRGAAVAVDNYGRIYVAGRTLKEEQTGDYLLLVYDKDGRLIDDKVYPFGGDSWASGIALDVYGNIVLTGTVRLNDQPAVVTTVRLEGYPVPGGFLPEQVFDNKRNISLKPSARPMIRKVGLSVKKANPRHEGSPLIFVASPVSVPGDYEYRFFVAGRNDAHHWEAVTDYTDRNFWIFKPAPKSNDPNKIMVQVRAKGSGLEYEAEEVLEIGQVN